MSRRNSRFGAYATATATASIFENWESLLSCVQQRLYTSLSRLGVSQRSTTAFFAHTVSFLLHCKRGRC